MRSPWPTALAGAALAAVGAVGLIRGALPLGAASGGNSAAAAPIVVSNAYVRPPVAPTDAAAAYFTVYNTTAKDDTLLTVTTGAGATSVLYAITNGHLAAAANGAVIPAHGRLILSAGRGQVVIEHLVGKLLPGQSVNLDLDFANAGPIVVTATVIAVVAPAATSPPSTK